MKYIDGFLLIVPKDKIEDYKVMAQQGRDVWMKHGALAYYECMGEELSSEGFGNEMLPFSVLTKANENETVWFSFIIFESKEHRDEVNAKVMADPAMSPDVWKDKEMPFDMKRMSYGGFEAVVEG